jgi:hypothetical protein
MSNKRITDLSELTTPTTDDVLPIVDIASNTTQKVQVGNLPTTTAVTNALAAKQETLVSGTNIKTVNSTSLLGSGDVAVQETLVSGTNIKTVNSTSLLGSGDIVISANPSGVAGAIQFSDGSAFASDAANLFWDDANNRLGVGTNTPSVGLEVKTTNVGDFDYVNFRNGNNANTARFKANGGVILGVASDFAINAGSSTLTRFSAMIGSLSSPTARLQVVGSGTTSATTALLVQNSAGTSLFSVRDDGTVNIGLSTGGVILVQGFNNTFIQNRLSFYQASTNIRGINAGGQGLIVSKNTGISDLYPSSIFAIDSTTQGFLPPRMTTTEKNAIATPAAGLVVYDTTLNKLCVYTTAWETITSL